MNERLIQILDLPSKCMNYRASRNQRATELSRGEGLEGTKGFENAGCFKCNGLNYDCPSFFNLRDYRDGC